MRARAHKLVAWAQQIIQAGDYRHLVVLGMGGSSLASSLYATVRSDLALTVINTTHPDEIARHCNTDLSRCLFIVASKSGTTIETVSLYRYLYARLAEQNPNPASQFVLITDEGSVLHQTEGAKFSKIFLNPADIGGRYGALSYFGLVPAALLGIDVDAVLAHAKAFSATTKSDNDCENQALALGKQLGRGACAGKDKLILHLPLELAALGFWIEQLIAESTGKNGKGLLPVIAFGGSTADRRRFDENDCMNISIGISNSHRSMDAELPHANALYIGSECFRWQFATAIAASYLQINPFDEPNVEQSKKNTRLCLAGQNHMSSPSTTDATYDLHCAGIAAAAVSKQAIFTTFRQAMIPNGYLALLTYLPTDPELIAMLQTLSKVSTDRLAVITTLCAGPGYLHSTGQFHKGGPPTGCFIQFIAGVNTDIPIPGCTYTFGELHLAQADGDFLSLANAGRIVMRVRLKMDTLRSLAVFISEFTDF